MPSSAGVLGAVRNAARVLTPYSVEAGLKLRNGHQSRGNERESFRLIQDDPVSRPTNCKITGELAHAEDVGRTSCCNRCATPARLATAIVLCITGAALFLTSALLRERKRTAALRAMVIRRGFVYLGRAVPRSLTLHGTPLEGQLSISDVF